jgi:hypothetical protein
VKNASHTSALKKEVRSASIQDITDKQKNIFTVKLGYRTTKDVFNKVFSTTTTKICIALKKNLYNNKIYNIEYYKLATKLTLQWSQRIETVR